MITAIAIGVVLGNSIVASIEPVSLMRIYAKDDSAKYDATVQMHGMGDMNFTFQLTTKVTALEDGGKAQVSMSSTTITPSADTESGMTPPEPKPMTYLLDKCGFPQMLETSDSAFPYIFYILSSIVPGESLNPGQSIDVAWKGTKKEDKIEGKGKFDKIQTVNGLQAAKLNYDLRVMPANEQTAGSLKLTSWVTLNTGKLLKSEGKMQLDTDGKFFMTFALNLAK